MNIQEHGWELFSSTQEEAELVKNKIIAFNGTKVPFTQTNAPLVKSYTIKEKGEILAGINAFITRWNILQIDILFVDERYRGHGLGSLLLKRVESEATELGVTLAYLDTFDFQAKDFYLKQGYEVFGVLEGNPKGHCQYYLKKSLQQ